MGLVDVNNDYTNFTDHLSCLTLSRVLRGELCERLANRSHRQSRASDEFL